MVSEELCFDHKYASYPAILNQALILTGLFYTHEVIGQLFVCNLREERLNGLDFFTYFTIFTEYNHPDQTVIVMAQCWYQKESKIFVHHHKLGYVLVVIIQLKQMHKKIVSFYETPCKCNS
jgi:hypothetical protein